MVDDLTDRELEVAEKITLGFSEKEVADQLCVSYKTIHAHTRNIRRKLNARCAVDIARAYILSMENPKQYFSAMVMMVIQIMIIVGSYGYGVRKLPRMRPCRPRIILNKNFNGYV